jgi:CHAT domain-containing protein
MYAGSQAVIVSLWQVDDAITAWLMTRFHQYLLTGNSTAEALTFAQRDIIQRNFSDEHFGTRGIEIDEPIKQAINSHNNATSRNPYYWAPFILIGNGFVKR